MRVLGEDGVVAVVDDDAEGGRLADRLDMSGQPGLLGEDQIGRQQQDAVGAGTLDGGCEFGRHRRAIADAGQHRHAAGRLLHRGRHHVDHLGRRQREEFAGAAGCEQAGHLIAAEPVEIGAIARGVEAIVAASNGVTGNDSSPLPIVSAISFGVILLIAAIPRCEGVRIRPGPMPRQTNCWIE